MDARVSYFISIIMHCNCFYSEIFSDGKSNKTVGGRLVDTFSVFKKGIHPSWEDAENKKGCEIFLRKTLSADMTDLYWENLILGILGQTIEEDDELCGCRIVDKTKKTSKDPRPVHRFEVWLRTRDDSAVDKCKQRVADTLTDGKASKNLVDQFGYSSHA